MNLYSIGHSNASLAAFQALLERHQISALADARSRPYSRYNPHFSRERLKQSLEENGINYFFLGDRIGGKPENSAFRLENGRIDYEALSRSEIYLAGLARLMEIGKTNRTAFMCAEADYKNCHRYWLITRSLIERGVNVTHILHSGETADSSRSDFEIQQPSLF